MKKQIITVIGITACVALCAAVWPRSAKVEVISIIQEKPALIDDIAATQEERYISYSLLIRSYPNQWEPKN